MKSDHSPLLVCPHTQSFPSLGRESHPDSGQQEPLPGRAGPNISIPLDQDAEPVETLAGPSVQLQPGPLAASTRPRTHLAQSGMGNLPMASRGAGSWSPGSADTNLKASFLGKPPGQARRACGDLQGCQVSKEPRATQETELRDFESGLRLC